MEQTAVRFRSLQSGHVAKMDTAVGFEPTDCRFESCHARAKEVRCLTSAGWMASGMGGYLIRPVLGCRMTVMTSDLVSVSQDHHESDLQEVPQEGEATQ